MTYVLLSGAKKNIGDFLILDRAKKLLRQFRPEHELITLNGWEPLDDRLDEVNGSDALIFCGGPNISKTFYPGVYPLTKNLNKIKAPKVVLGGGWNEIPGTKRQLNTYSFTASSRRVLESCRMISCRDNQTIKVLEKNGLKGVMTGCPVWYDLNYINKAFEKRASINKVVFTIPQFHTMPRLYDEQCIEVMRVVKELFSDAKLYCSFHRGLKSDEFTFVEEEPRLLAVKDVATELGYEIVDAGYDLSKISFYEDCDLHVGYRLHGHIDFLSQRKPSVLLNVDARGKGFGETIGLPGIQAWSIGLLAEPTYQIGNWIGKYNLLNKVTRIVSNHSALRWSQRLLITGNSQSVRLIRSLLVREKATGFESYLGLESTFQKHFETMKDFLARLP